MWGTHSSNKPVSSIFKAGLFGKTGTWKLWNVCSICGIGFLRAYRSPIGSVDSPTTSHHKLLLSTTLNSLVNRILFWAKISRFFVDKVHWTLLFVYCISHVDRIFVIFVCVLFCLALVSCSINLINQYSAFKIFFQRSFFISWCICTFGDLIFTSEAL